MVENIILTLNFMAAILTVLYIGRLVLTAYIASNDDGYADYGFVKKSLLNQVIHREIRRRA